MTSNAHIEHLRQQALAQGVLPASAQPPSHDERPWPVVLLTALGAWLAAVPLIGVVGLLLGDLVQRGTGPYLIGSLVLAAAAVVLRSRDVPLFIEQLAVPGLLVGGGALGFGLYRDWSQQAASLLLAGIALVLALLFVRAWLRVLLGSAAAFLLAMGLTPAHTSIFSHGVDGVFWMAWHGVLVAWSIGSFAQARLGQRLPRIAAAMESLLAGVLLAMLVAFAWWSGMSFLAGATLAPDLRQIADAAFLPANLRERVWLQAISGALGLAALARLAIEWPTVRRPWCLIAGVVLVVLCAFMPALGAVCFTLAACAASQRWRLAAAAGLSAAWIIGAFYYRLDWPLQSKALLLIGAGALLAALARWAPRRATRNSSGPASAALATHVQAAIAITVLATLVTVNLGIWRKERLIAEGQALFIELAPADPRSLMQGDYMRLNFRVPLEVERQAEHPLWAHRPRVIAQRDARGVVTRLRADDGTALAADELRIELTPKDGRWIIVTDAWFFAEGEARRWSAARYGEFRVTPDGQALLVGLRGAQLEAL